jgi:hypothetical protein
MHQTACSWHLAHIVWALDLGLCIQSFFVFGLVPIVPYFVSKLDVYRQKLLFSIEIPHGRSSQINDTYPVISDDTQNLMKPLP